MRRLLKRLRGSKTDPELLAGLTHASRYCGLLQASLEAHRQARRLDPNILTTVSHTYFAVGDYQAALDASGPDFGYFTTLRVAMLGRVEEAIAMLKEKEATVSERLGQAFMFSLRMLLEGNPEASVKASDELIIGGFQDPEGQYYLARQLAYLSDICPERPNVLKYNRRWSDTSATHRWLPIWVARSNSRRRWLQANPRNSASTASGSDRGVQG